MIDNELVNYFASTLVKCKRYMEKGYCKKEDCEHCSKGDFLKYINTCSPEEKTEIFHTANFLAAGGNNENIRKNILFEKKWKKFSRKLKIVTSLPILYILMSGGWDFGYIMAKLIGVVCVMFLASVVAYIYCASWND